MTSADRMTKSKTEMCCGTCYYWRHRSEKDIDFNRLYCALPGHSHNIFPDDGPCEDYAPRLQKEANDG